MTWTQKDQSEQLSKLIDNIIDKDVIRVLRQANNQTELAIQLANQIEEEYKQ